MIDMPATEEFKKKLGLAKVLLDEEVSMSLTVFEWAPVISLLEACVEQEDDPEIRKIYRTSYTKLLDQLPDYVK